MKKQEYHCVLIPPSTEKSDLPDTPNPKDETPDTDPESEAI